MAIWLIKQSVCRCLSLLCLGLNLPAFCGTCENDELAEASKLSEKIQYAISLVLINKKCLSQQCNDEILLRNALKASNCGENLEL